MNEVEYRYREDEFLQEALDHIKSTYGAHYAMTDEQQIFDVWEGMGIEIESCLSNIQKYVYRFGKKSGYNKKDVYKMIHYALIMLHYVEKRGLAEDSDK